LTIERASHPQHGKEPRPLETIKMPDLASGLDIILGRKDFIRYTYCNASVTKVLSTASILSLLKSPIAEAPALQIRKPMSR
jgi:hypothetical protein